jgi:trimethylamine--corrinoid protein Co-methyltransferase
MTGLLPSLAGSSFIYGMGMLEMGMTMSYEQLLIDAEIVKMIRRILQGIAVNDETLAVDIIKAVGPAGTYLSQRHTMKHMRKESSQTTLIDRRMYEGWEKAGSKDMYARANEEAKRILESHKPLPLPDAAAKAIRKIVEEAAGELAERKKFNG